MPVFIQVHITYSPCSGVQGQVHHKSQLIYIVISSLFMLIDLEIIVAINLPKIVETFEQRKLIIRQDNLENIDSSDG